MVQLPGRRGELLVENPALVVYSEDLPQIQWRVVGRRLWSPSHCATKQRFRSSASSITGGSSSAVERVLAKDEVEGSTPFFRSISFFRSFSFLV
jgi:hypothetical protein